MSYSWGAGRTSARGNGACAAGVALDTTPSSTPRRQPEVSDIAEISASSRPAADSAAPTREQQRVAAELAPMVEVWQRLLAQHVPDRGGRCRTCTKGGTGLPSTPWPCVIYGIADLARRFHDGEQQRNVS